MRIIFIASDEEVADWKRQAKAVRMNFSVFIRARLNGTVGGPNEAFWNPPLTAEQKAEIEVHMPKVGDTVKIKKPAPFVPVNYDVTVEVGPTPNATRAQYEKAAKHLADRIDTSLCQHNMMKAACPRCSPRI